MIVLRFVNVVIYVGTLACSTVIKAYILVGHRNYVICFVYTMSKLKSSALLQSKPSFATLTILHCASHLVILLLDAYG